MPPFRLLPLAAFWNLPTTWIIVWIGLLAATAALIGLLRTRLRRVKPWQKCALLSLWVHVLLACLTAAVRIVSGGAGGGPEYGPPIQVALLPAEIEPLALSDDSPTVQPEETTTANDSLTLDEPTKAVDATPESAPQPFEAPELLAQQEPITAEPLEPTAAEQAIDASPAPAMLATEQPIAAPPSHAAESTSAPQVELAPAIAAAASDRAETRSPVSAPPRPQLPAPYAARFAANRAELVVAGGGNARTEQAVQAALQWLAAAQSPDGRWDAKRHGAGREYYVLGQDRGGAGARADAGVSGLALLAFLGAGHTHREGLFQPQVGSGLEYLRHTQQADGNLGGDAGLFAQMYCHSMASFAVSEAYAMTADERLAPTVRAAVRYTLAAQHPTDGGWRYRPGDSGDVSQLGWQAMVLRSAERCDVAVPPVVWTRVDRFLRQVERGRFGGLAVYRPEEARPTRTMTAEALYCRQLSTGRADGELSPAALQEAIDSLLAELPSTEHVNLYYWYYATLALHGAQRTSPEAAEAWRRWNDSLTRTLLAMQNADGSWPETCIWAGYGGRVFTTALGAMCLEVYYRYLPPDDSVVPADIAQRHEWQSATPR